MSGAEWTFESRVTVPNGIAIRSEIRLPEGLAGADSLELVEIAEMGVVRMATTMKGLLRSRKQAVVVDATIHCGKSGVNGGCGLEDGHVGMCSFPDQKVCGKWFCPDPHDAASAQCDLPSGHTSQCLPDREVPF